MNAQGVFRFGPYELPYAWNEGERAVEIPIARLFYERHGAREDFVEVGAVTPYWWEIDKVVNWWRTEPVARVPHRVVDPFDAYERAERVQAQDLDVRGLAVLSVSTLEHVGLGHYGGAYVPEHAIAAFDRIRADAAAYLVTWAVGQHPVLDQHAERLAAAGQLQGFAFEQTAPHEYRQRDGWCFSCGYGFGGEGLPYGRDIVFATNDAALLALAEATPR